MTRQNLDHWLTKAEAAERLEISERTLDRLGQAGPERKMRRRDGKRPEPVFNPADVETLSAAAARPVVLPALVKTGSNGDIGEMPAGLAQTLALLERFATLLHRPAVEAAAVPLTQKLYLTIEEAKEYSGLSQALLRRQCRAGKLGLKDGNAWKIRRSDLDSEQKRIPEEAS